MPRRGAITAILVASAMACWSGSGVADDPDAGAQWEQVEPENQSPDMQSSPGNQPRQMPRELCSNVGSAVAQLVVLRDRGIPKERLMNGLAQAGANGKVQGYVTGYIDFIYDHPEMSPAQIKAHVESGCAQTHN
jgi:hypothetical protein